MECNACNCAHPSTAISPPPPPSTLWHGKAFTDNGFFSDRYATWMVNDGMLQHRVYVDETGLNLHLSRSRGRAAVGDRANRVVCGQRGRNMTVITAISDQVGVLYYEVVWGGVTAEVFGDFLASLGAVLGDEAAVIIMDNAPAHRGAELADGRVRMLPPYSPCLNPIENMFSVFKADLKQRLSHVQGRLDDRAAALAAGHRGLTSWRSEILEDLAHQAMPAITAEKVSAAYRHSNSFLGACLAREDIVCE